MRKKGERKEEIHQSSDLQGKERVDENLGQTGENRNLEHTYNNSTMHIDDVPISEEERTIEKKKHSELASTQRPGPIAPGTVRIKKVVNVVDRTQKNRNSRNQSLRFARFTTKDDTTSAAKLFRPLSRAFTSLDRMYEHSDIETQQRRLDAWLESFYKRYTESAKKQPTVYYEVDEWAGMGNMFRGYFSAMAIAVSTNRIVKSVWCFAALIPSYVSLSLCVTVLPCTIPGQYIQYELV